VLQGVLIHKLVVDFYQVQLSPVQRAEQRLCSMQQRLQRLVELNYTSLLQPLPPQERQVGVCRDFAVFLVSLLRHKGIPARMRVGFAAYLDPSGTYRYDHWITEYWDAAHEQWRLVDPQIDDIQRQHLKITANTLNLRGGKDFYLAGQAWQLCRQGKDRSLLFRFNGHWKGMPCIRGNHDEMAAGDLALLGINRQAFDAMTWTRGQLDAERRAWLGGLPLLHEEPDAVYVHASLDAPHDWHYVHDAQEAAASFVHQSRRVCFIGHTHQPAIFCEDLIGRTVVRDVRAIVNVGSVGQPRDGNANAAFGVFDTKKGTYELVRIAYPIEIAAKKIYHAGLPPQLGERLVFGI